MLEKLKTENMYWQIILGSNKNNTGNDKQALGAAILAPKPETVMIWQHSGLV